MSHNSLSSSSMPPAIADMDSAIWGSMDLAAGNEWWGVKYIKNHWKDEIQLGWDICVFLKGIEKCYIYYATKNRPGAGQKIVWLIFSRSPKSPQGLVLVAQDCWCHAVHCEGCTPINIWVCVSGESEMTLSLSVVFGVVASSRDLLSDMG